MTELQIDRKQLKQLSLEVRDIASRLINSDWEDADANLVRFLNFIDSDPIISDFIARHNHQEFDISSIRAERGYHEPYPVPTDTSGEIAFTYQLLKSAIRGYMPYLDLSRGYGTGTKHRDHVAAFNQRVVRPFVSHITRYLRSLMDEAGPQDSDTTSVHIQSVQQFNLAQGNSRIYAVNLADAQDLANAAQRFLGLLAQEDLPEDKRQELTEIAAFALEESNSTRPKRSLLKTLGGNLTSLMGNVKLTNETLQAGQELADRLSQVLPGL